MSFAFSQEEWDFHLAKLISRAVTLAGSKNNINVHSVVACLYIFGVIPKVGH